MSRLRQVARQVIPSALWDQLIDLRFTAGRGLGLQLMFMTGRLPSSTLRSLIYRVMGLTSGPDVSIYRGLEIRDPHMVRIGRGTVIGFDCILDGRGGLEIGEHVNFSSQVAIWTQHHDHRSESFAVVSAPVRVGDRAWLSFRSTILGGVTVGEGAVVMAGAVVSKDVEPWTVVGGVPARKIGERPRVGYEFEGGAQWFV